MFTAALIFGPSGGWIADVFLKAIPRSLDTSESNREGRSRERGR
jgi:hypothetical protein